MMTRRHFKGKGLQCYHCKQYGHIQTNCLERADKAEEAKSKQGGAEKGKGSAKPKKRKEELVTTHALSAAGPTHDWRDSGATCHICSSKFQEF